MPRKRTQKIYFGEEQEQAVVRYLESDSETEKNKIFNEYLREPLIIMVESIIRRYKLYRKDLEFVDIHADTMSFLITKMNKFDHTKNHKAFSYFGTICKNYLMGAIQKDTKEMNRSVSYDAEELSENEQKLGYALLEIFGNFEKIFQIGDGNKFNKNLILLSLREMTSLSTKEIRISMRKYKKLYEGIMLGFIN